jgi:hypothetical protein
VLEHSLAFAPGVDASFFEQVPAAPAVFLLRGDQGEPYISKSASLRRRLERLLATGSTGKRLNLRSQTRGIEYSLTGSDFESTLLLYRLLRANFPENYRDRLRIRPAPLIRLNLDNPYPRAYVTRRIARLDGRSRYYGPFPSRAAAEKFLNGALDFFKMRRCDFELDPDPAFPGCIYSEMKMCLAPCFKGCSDDEYGQEVTRVQDFLETGGASLQREMGAWRDKASQDLQFEAAAALHTRMEKLHALLGHASLPEIARPLERLTGVLVQPSAKDPAAARPGAVTLFRLDGGSLSPPAQFPVEAHAAAVPASSGRQPQSMESRVTTFLAAMPPARASSAAELVEHIALLRRWHYRTHKTGELFLSDDHGELPLRRIVRGIGRVFRGEKAESLPQPG